MSDSFPQKVIEKFSHNISITEFGLYAISIQISISESDTKPEIVYPIEISTISFEQLELFATNDYNFPVFEKNGNQYKIVYQDKGITQYS